MFIIGKPKQLRGLSEYNDHQDDPLAAASGLSHLFFRGYQGKLPHLLILKITWVFSTSKKKSITNHLVPRKALLERSTLKIKNDFVTNVHYGVHCADISIF